MYTFWADLIAAVHLSILGFVVLGELIIVAGWLCGWQWARNFWFRLAHLVIIGVVVYEAMYDIMCPLTVWEDKLRALAGGESNDQTFVGRIVNEILVREGFDFNDPILQNSYYYFGGLVALTLILVPPRWPRRKNTALAQTPAVSGSDPQGA